MDELERLSTKVDHLAALTHAFADHLGNPVFYRDNTKRFRFVAPDHRHFCLLRASRIVSALYASIELAKAGFSQEIGVLLRTVIEFCAQIDYVLLKIQNSDGEVSEFLRDFFEDDFASRNLGKKPRSIRQKSIHNALGAVLDQFKDDPSNAPASNMMSNIYITFSNYVHGRYPESMDLYGGQPGHFHLFGMAGTPKNRENVQFLETYYVTVSNTFAGMVQGLKLFELLRQDAALASWYDEAVT